MVKHIVMWRFKPEIKEEEKDGLKKAMEEGLISLVGKVPGLLKVEFVPVPLSTSTHDMALVTLLESEEALQRYSGHPEHVAVADQYVRPYVHERSCLDYSTEDIA